MNPARSLPPLSALPTATDSAADEARMLRILLASVDGMVYRRRLDASWTMEFVSAGCQAITGRTPQDLLQGRDACFEDLIHADDRLWVREAIACAIGNGKPFDLEYRLTHADGSIRWVWERGAGIPGGDAATLEGLIQDITARKNTEQALREAERRYHGLLHQANYDTLTGLANRSLLQDRLEQALLTSATSGTRIAVAFVDLDRFKFINDRLGHQFGDNLLRAVAGRVQSCVRECDTVARHGGDEFVLLINGHAGADSVHQVMERMLAAVSEPWVIEQGTFDVTCSIGIALHPEDGDDAQTLLKNADSAMYRAKDSGGNTCQFFTRELGSGPAVTRSIPDPPASHKVCRSSARRRRCTTR